jgi:acid phosphatase type 7
MINDSGASPAFRVNRRKFVVSLGVLGAAAGLMPLRGSTPSSSEKTAGPLMKCRPYLQASRRDGITVRWITTRRSYSWVEYGESPAMLNQKAVQVEDGLARADTTVHAIRLNRLQPGKTYHYRVVSREVLSLARKEVSFGRTESSETHRFTTPAEDPGQVEFLVLNDIHDRPESFAALMKHQEPGRKDCVFLNGDMFNFLESEDQIINHLVDPLTQGFATHTPFYFVRGNHETWGDFSRQLRDYFDGGAEKFFYSLPLGPVYALVMDSGESKPDDHAVHGGIHAFDDYRETQARWLEEEVRKPAFKQAAFKVVLVHIPPFYMGEPVHASIHCRERWVPILNRAGIDLMICGHTHKHGVHPAVPGQHHFPIVIGGGPRDGNRTIIAVKASRRALSLTMRNDAGKQVGQLQLDAS